MYPSSKSIVLIPPFGYKEVHEMLKTPRRRQYMWNLVSLWYSPLQLEASQSFHMLNSVMGLEC